MEQYNDFLAKEHYKKLASFDTIHDFWKDRAKTTDDDDEGISGDQLDFIQQSVASILTNSTLNPSSNQGSIINSYLETNTDRVVSSATSNYERNIVSYFEKLPQYNNILGSQLKETVTYQDIINSWLTWKEDKTIDHKNKIPPSWEALCGSEQNDRSITHKVLELDFDSNTGPDGQAFLMKNYNIVAYFILKYYYPKDDLKALYFTFDAKSGPIGKIFKGIDQVSNLVMPQNIADSATTSFSQFGDRNIFSFPKNDGNAYKVKSNIFSSSNTQIEFVEDGKGFNNKNPFGFKIKVNKEGQQIFFDFNKDVKEGASVNYLADLIYTYNKKQKSIKDVKPTKPQIVNISEGLDSILRNSGGTRPNQEKWLAQFLFDLKRTGDYEQVIGSLWAQEGLGAPVVFSTIDHLCSLFSRLIGKNSCLHYGQKLVLYRVPSGTIDPSVQEAYTYYSKAKVAESYVNKVKIISIFTKELEELNQNIDNALDNGLFKSKNKKDDKYGGMDLAKMIKELIRIKLLDIKSHVSEIIAPDSTLVKATEAFKQIDYDTKNVFASIQEKFLSLANKNDFIEWIKNERINDNLSYIEGLDVILNISNALPEFDEIMNMFSIPESVLNSPNPEFNLNKTLLDAKNNFNKNTTLSQFNYNCSSYYKLYDILMTMMHSIMQSLMSTKRSNRLGPYQSITQAGYFNIVNEITKYHNSIIEEQINKFLFIQYNDQWKNNIDKESEDILSYFGFEFIEFKKKFPIISTIGPYEYKTGLELYIPEYNVQPISEQELYENIEPSTIFMQQNGGKVLENETDFQVDDLNDLFRQLCYMSAGFIESYYTSNNESGALVGELLEKLMLNEEKKLVAKSLFNKLSNYWLYEYRTIQTNSTENGDAYNYVANDSDIYISFLLSLYTNEIDDNEINEKTVLDEYTFKQMFIDEYEGNKYYELVKSYPINVKGNIETIVLFIFTLFNNIMSPKLETIIASIKENGQLLELSEEVIEKSINDATTLWSNPNNNKYIGSYFKELIGSKNSAYNNGESWQVLSEDMKSYFSKFIVSTTMKEEAMEEPVGMQEVQKVMPLEPKFSFKEEITGEPVAGPSTEGKRKIEEDYGPEYEPQVRPYPKKQFMGQEIGYRGIYGGKKTRKAKKKAKHSRRPKKPSKKKATRRMKVKKHKKTIRK